MSGIIHLTSAEIQMCTSVGIHRRTESMRQNLSAKHGYGDETVWDTDVEGAAAELAFCKYRGMYWGGDVNTFKQADAGQNIQIRSTRLAHGSLIVRDNDDNAHYYVLVVGKIPTFTVVGWIIGASAKQPSWYKAPNNRSGAYFVPQTALNKFE